MPSKKLDPGTEALIADHVRDFVSIDAARFSDADIPHFKSWLAGKVAAGTPLLLNPTVARAAMKKGFVEHEHFEIVKPIPMQAISDGPFT